MSEKTKKALLLSHVVTAPFFFRSRRPQSHGIRKVCSEAEITRLTVLTEVQLTRLVLKLGSRRRKRCPSGKNMESI